MSSSDLPAARTPGIIARELGVTLGRVSRVLNTRPHIRPIGRAGTIRLYDRAAVAMVRHELNAQDARRARREAVHA